MRYSSRSCGASHLRGSNLIATVCELTRFVPAARDEASERRRRERASEGRYGREGAGNKDVDRGQLPASEYRQSTLQVPLTLEDDAEL